MAIARAMMKVGVLGAACSCLLLGQADRAAAANFNDTDGHWAETYIDALSDAGVLGGFPDGSFKPNDCQGHRQTRSFEMHLPVEKHYLQWPRTAPESRGHWA
ncbi:MAG: S-layer homology domain-containing protein, partial [Cyanobacteria bacterium J06639_1]